MKNLYTKTLNYLTLLTALSAVIYPQLHAEEIKSLFPDDGIPKDWVVRAWSNVGKSGPEGAQWAVEEGVINGGGPMGSS